MYITGVSKSNLVLLTRWGGSSGEGGSGKSKAEVHGAGLNSLNKVKYQDDVIKKRR